MASGACEIIVAGTAPEQYLGRLADGRFDHVIFLDAVDLGAAPGSVVLLDSTQMASARSRRFPPTSSRWACWPG